MVSSPPAAARMQVNNNSWVGDGVRYLRHARGGQAGFYTIPAGGQWNYRHEAYDCMALLVGGPGLGEWQRLQGMVQAGELGSRSAVAEWHAGPIPEGGVGSTAANLSAVYQGRPAAATAAKL